MSDEMKDLTPEEMASVKLPAPLIGADDYDEALYDAQALRKVQRARFLLAPRMAAQITRQQEWERRAVVSMDAASKAAGVSCCDEIPAEIAAKDARIQWLESREGVLSSHLSDRDRIIAAKDAEIARLKYEIETRLMAERSMIAATTSLR